VLTEAAWLLRGHPRKVERLLRGVSARAYRVIDLPIESAAWIGAFVVRYECARAQLADAAIMYLAEQEKISTVFTLDRRDFSVYRITDGRAMRMIP